MNELLCKMLKTPSPSGYELHMQKMLIEEMKPYDDKIITNTNYNVVHVINPKSPIKILLAGHVDEISLVINEIKEDGTCRVTKNGGIRTYMYAGQHVEVIKFKGNDIIRIPAVFGYLPNMTTKEVKVEDLILDLGTTSKEETLKLVSIGDPVVHMNNYVKLNDNILTARALDDRLGAYICLETLKRVKERKCNNGVYVATTVGEETTCRGAKTVAYQIEPTCAIIVDVSYANDIIYRENLSGDMKLGNGPILTIGSSMNSIIHNNMIKIAEKLAMPIQFEVSPSRTFTDADEIFTAHGGIPSYNVSIPLRYMHSSVEMCNLNDVENIIKLLVEFICSLNENSSFNPFEVDN